MLRRVAQRLTCARRSDGTRNLVRAFSNLSPDEEFAEGVKHLTNKSDSQSAAPKVRQAVLHWTNAAELGHVKAQSALGHLYLKGYGEDLLPDEILATRFLEQAANQGHSGSCHQLGRILLDGSNHVTQDVSKGLEMWHQAAESGHMAASYDLAHLYANGLHVEQDEEKAFTFYTKAATEGMAEAQYAVGKAYMYGKGTQTDPVAAVKHFRLAADQAYPKAQFDLGACYLMGKGVDKDPAKAAECFFVAAQSGIPEAQFLMGQMLEQGAGVPRDLAKAKELYEAAAKSGVKEAQEALKRL